MKYYAVAVGRTPGIYTTWDEAKKMVDKFPGAKFKSFATREEAQEFITPRAAATDLIDETSDDVITKTRIGKEKLPSDRKIVYTDGSCVKSVGGYGIVILGDDIITYSGWVPFEPCTNQKAELYAILKTLELIDGPLLIRTDSEYSIKSITLWSKAWMTNDWKRSDGQPVENRPLIEAIINLNRDVVFEHVYGHKGNKYNEMADKLANEGRFQ